MCNTDGHNYEHTELYLYPRKTVDTYGHDMKVRVFSQTPFKRGLQNSACWHPLLKCIHSHQFVVLVWFSRLVSLERESTETSLFFLVPTWRWQSWQHLWLCRCFLHHNYWIRAISPTLLHPSFPVASVPAHFFPVSRVLSVAFPLFCWLRYYICTLLFLDKRSCTCISEALFYLPQGKLCECECTFIFFQSFTQWIHLSKCDVNGLDNRLYIIMWTSNVCPANVGDYSFCKVYINWTFLPWVSWILCKCAIFVYKPVFMGLWLKFSPLSLLFFFLTQQLYIVSCTEWVNALKDWLLLCNIFKQIKFAMCKQHISMPSCLVGWEMVWANPG